jgi:hypothetical protein
MILYNPSISGSLVVTGSNISLNGVNVLLSNETSSISVLSSSFASTASYVLNGVSSSFSSNALTSSNAMTASSADTLYVRNNVTALGSITAQTLIVQTVTSSVLFTTGSNKIGSSLSNTQELTGSVGITGSLSVTTTGTEFQVSAGGVNIGNALTDNHIISGSLRVNPNGLFVSSSGFVGINNVSPTVALDVTGAAKFTSATGTNVTPQLTVTNTTTNGYGILRLVGASRGGIIDFYDTTTAQTSISGQGGALTFYTNGDSSGTAKMTITSAGNVGIGLTSILAKLHIENTSSADPTSLSSVPTTNIFGMSTSPGGMLAAGIGTTGGTHVWLQGRNVGGAGVSYPIVLQPLGGNVGIGTSSISPISTYTTLEIRGATGGGIKIGKTGFNPLNIQHDGTDAYINNVANGAFNIYTNDAPRVIVTSAGNVGIGTSSPKSYGALTISGQTIGLSNIAVDINQAFKFNNYYSSSAGSDKTISTGYAGSVGFDNSVGALTFSTSLSSVAADGNIVTSERMRITSGGNVGIGTSSPAEKLHIYGGGLGPELRMEGTWGSHWIRAYSDNFNLYTAGGRQAISMNNAGSVFNYNNTTTWQQTSDIRVKENINTISNALDVITSLNPVSFNYKQEFAEKNNWDDNIKLNNIGFIAQEFESVFPKYVYSKEYSLEDTLIEDFKSIDTGHLVPYLVKAIQELKAENDSLKEVLLRNNIV